MIEVTTSKIGWAEDGADYTHFSSWLASCELNGIFNVGIVRGNEFMKGGYPEPFQDLGYSHYIDYLLVHATGRIIAWNYRDNNFLDKTSLLENSRSHDWYNKQCVHVIEEFLKGKLSQPYEIHKSIYIDKIVSQKSSLIITPFQQINDELVEYLLNNPDALHSLHWRQFEELLEAVFKNQGFNTELGPGRADGGVDLRLIQRADIGNMLILVQAKKYAKHRKIQLDPVKALWASVEDEQANKGILVSTSEFIPAAKEFAARHPYRIELAGPERIVSWLLKFRNSP